MPLSCDCFDGCWGQHSRHWPSIAIPEVLIEIGRERGERYPHTLGNFLIFSAKIPYGCYVVDDGMIRVDDTQHVAGLKNAIVRMREYSSPEAWLDAQIEIKRIADKAYWDAAIPISASAAVATGAKAVEEPPEPVADQPSAFDARIADFITENVSIEVETETGYYDSDQKAYTIRLKLGEREISVIRFNN